MDDIKNNQKVSSNIRTRHHIPDITDSYQGLYQTAILLALFPIYLFIYLLILDESIILKKKETPEISFRGCLQTES